MRSGIEPINSSKLRQGETSLKIDIILRPCLSAVYIVLYNDPITWGSIISPHQAVVTSQEPVTSIAATVRILTNCYYSAACNSVTVASFLDRITSSSHPRVSFSNIGMWHKDTQIFKKSSTIASTNSVSQTVQLQLLTPYHAKTGQ